MESVEFKCAFCGKPFWTLYYPTGDQDQVYCDEHEEQVNEKGYGKTVEEHLARGKQMYKGE